MVIRRLNIASCFLRFFDEIQQIFPTRQRKIVLMPLLKAITAIQQSRQIELTPADLL